MVKKLDYITLYTHAHTHTRFLSEMSIILDTHPRYPAGLYRHSSLYNPPSPVVEDWSAKVASS